MYRRQGYTRNLLTGAPVPFGRVTAYELGTLDLATIYRDNGFPPTLEDNPFLSDATGYWKFYAPDGSRVDVRFDQGVPAIPTPYTWGDVDFPVPGQAYAATSFGLPETPSGAIDNSAALARVSAAAAVTGGAIILPPGDIGIQSQWAPPLFTTVLGNAMNGTRLVRMSGFAGGLPTVHSQQIFGGIRDVEINNNNVAGDGLHIANGNYNDYVRILVRNVVNGTAGVMKTAGSNHIISCVFWATGNGGQAFKVDNTGTVMTNVSFVNPEFISSSPTLRCVELYNLLNMKWFGGSISADNGPALYLGSGCTGANLYAPYTETSPFSGASAYNVELESCDDIHFHGGTFSDNRNADNPPIFLIRRSAQGITLDGNAHVGRETADGSPQIVVELQNTSQVQQHVFESIGFRCSVDFTAIEAIDGSTPGSFTIRQLRNRAGGRGSIKLKARDSYLGQCSPDMPIELVAGSLPPVTIDGCRGTLTDPDFAANSIGRNNIGITHGSGSPEGVVPANLGQLYINTSGGIGTSLWVKRQSGGGATGWFAVG